MDNKAQQYIDDARRFQKCGDHEFAISTLQLAQQMDVQKEYYVEIQKLLSFSYRKINNYEMALYHINNAINWNAKMVGLKAQTEYAICLMNKGIIYEDNKHYSKAVNTYRMAVDIFISLYQDNPDEYGLIINALITLGSFYYKQNDFRKAKCTLESSLKYFGEGKETDRRYVTICSTLRELETQQEG